MEELKPNQMFTEGKVKREMEMNVRALLVAYNLKQKDIAEKYFIHPSELCRVIKGKRKTQYIRTILSHLLNIPVEQLWKE